MPIIFTPGPLVQRSQFYQQLGQLLGAGLPVLKALDLLHRKPPGLSYREPIQRLIEQISQGGTVTDAMRSLGKWTPQFDLALIHAGETSGRLDIVFRLLSDHYAERAALARQMIVDLMYPMFLLHFAVLLFGFIAWLGSASPLSVAARTIGVLGPIYLLIFALIYAAQSRHGEAWRSFVERVLRPVPMLGTARHSIALSRLAAALEALLNAGVRVIEAWDLAAAASGSPALQRVVISWKPRLDAGLTPADLVSSSSEFPEVFSNLYSTGEVSGQLDESLHRLHEYYKDEGSRKMKLVTKWTPQVIYLGAMLFCAWKIISFYLGYFKQVGQAGGF